MIRAMSTELFLNFLGIRMDSRKAEGMRFTINLVTPDNGEKFIVEMENATLTNIAGFQADKPDLTLTINRSDLEQTMMGAKTLEAQIADGTAKVEGDVGRPRASSPRPWSTSTRASRSCPARRRGPPKSRTPIPTRPCHARPSRNKGVTETERSVYCLRHTAICMRIILSHGKVNIFNLAKNAGTSVEQIERFYAKHLPLSREMAKNLQSFGEE